jgi:hypothetical protein
MQKYRLEERKQATYRGLDYLYGMACDPENFETWGHDYLGCFSGIAATSLDNRLRRQARSMGRERAHLWQRQHRAIPRDADAETIVSLVFGCVAVEGLGMPDGVMRDKVRRAAGRFTAEDYYWFDPAKEPPPRDVPYYCDCGLYNRRGRKFCKRCKKQLQMVSPYEVWTDSLIRSYMAECYGVVLGAPYADVLKWIEYMRPYPERDNDPGGDFYSSVYAVTHVVYTLNHYSVYRLPLRLLPYEYRFLKANLNQAIEMQDPEMMGEFLDALMAFGLGDNNPLIRKGIDYLLSTQNADGSWGEVDREDLYRLYHPTWTAIDGLREYRWKGVGLSFPKLKPLLKRAKKSRSHSLTPALPFVTQ